MSFTDQKPRVATEADMKLPYGGRPAGERFRCYLCGHKFQVGDTWRFVFAPPFRNFLTCQACDGPDILERWKAQNEELKKRFWWAIRER